MSILLALSACGGQESANQTPAAQASSASASDTATASDAEKKAEHYIGGTDASFPPFDFKEKDGSIAGFDVEILNAIAQDQNFSASFLAILAFNFCQFLENLVLFLKRFCSFANLPFRFLNALIGSKYSPLDKVAKRTMPISIPISPPLGFGVSVSNSV